MLQPDTRTPACKGEMYMRRPARLAELSLAGLGAWQSGAALPLRRSLAETDHDEHHAGRYTDAADPGRDLVMLLDLRFNVAHFE